LFELSIHDKLIWLAETAVPVRLLGAAGGRTGVGVELGAAVGVAVAVGLGVGVAVGLGVGVDVGLGVVVGVGVGVVLLICRIFATEGMPFEFRMKSM